MNAIHALALISTVALAQNNCNYYKSGSWYYATNKCSPGATYGINSLRDRQPWCFANGTMLLYSYTSSDGSCSGTRTQSTPSSSTYKCNGVQCSFEYGHGSSSFGSSNNCSAQTPPIVYSGVPGYCADGTFKATCGPSNQVYFVDSCSSSNPIPTLVSTGTCLTSGVDIQFRSCVDPTNTPPQGGVAGYKTAYPQGNCNFVNRNGTVEPIDKCIVGFLSSHKSRCTDANTLEYGSWIFDTTCSGTPTVTTYKRGDPWVDFLCTGMQCIIEDRSYSSSTSCTGSFSTTYYIPGRCSTSQDKYFCYGGTASAPTSIMKEYYSQFGRMFTGSCNPEKISTTSNTNYNASTCTSTTHKWSCKMDGAKPAFGSVGAGHMMSLDVGLLVAALFAVFGL